MPKGMQETPMEKRLRREIERLYGNEALTSYMDDDTANVFLKWAANRVEAIVRSTEGMEDAQAEEEMYPRMRALRKMSRYINRLVSDGGEQEVLLEKIVQQARTVYGDSFREPDQAKLQSILYLPQGDPGLFVHALRHLFEGENNVDETNN